MHSIADSVVRREQVAMPKSAHREPSSGRRVRRHVLLGAFAVALLGLGVWAWWNIGEPGPRGGAGPAAEMPPSAVSPAVTPMVADGPSKVAPANESSPERITAQHAVVVAVRDDRGEPVEGATVRMSGRADTKTDAGGLAVFADWQDEHGFVDLDATGDPERFVDRRAAQREVTRGAERDILVEFTVARAGRLRVEVPGITGHCDIQLVRKSVEADGFACAPQRVAIDATGTAEFAGLPPGPFEVWAFFAPDSPFVPTNATATVASGETSTVALTPVRGAGKVHGVVLAPDGKPLAGATVEALPVFPFATGPGKVATSAADGTFALVGLPQPEVWVGVDVRSLPDANYAFFGTAQQPRLRVRVDGAEPLRLQLQPGFRLVGACRAAGEDSPMVFLSPEQYDIEGQVRARAADDGRIGYEFRHLRPGDYVLRSSAEPDRRVRVTIDEVSCPDHVCRVDL